jgi:tagaturonate reductase
VLQFGTGNFMRGFPDWVVDLLNEKAGFNGNIQMIQVHGRKPAYGINAQDGLYHVLIRGYQNGATVEENRLVDSVAGAINPYLEYPEFLSYGELPELEFIFSNTTEAGIYYDEKDKNRTIPPESFPGKLTALLFHRYEHFKGDPKKGLIILPCELIEDNGKKLKEIVLRYAERWDLPAGFSRWVDEKNSFCNTLVDRIVPGYPVDMGSKIQEKLGYKDEQLVMAEPFHFWAIEGPDILRDKFPAEKIGLDVKVVKDLKPYRTRKVRILNGAHTAMVPVAYLKGLRLVKEAVDDPETGKFLKETIFEEIIPSLDPPKEELHRFANDVIDRFKNPFIKHQLSAIALNSISKFKVRVLPSILEYIKRREKAPKNLARSFAALIVFYRGHYGGFQIPLNDKPQILAFFDKIWKIKDAEGIVESVFAKIDFWERDLNLVPHLSHEVIKEVERLLAEEKK